MDIARILHPVSRSALALATFAIGLASCTQADAPQHSAANAAEPAQASAAPAGGADRVLLWGDTHVHTRNSIDAYASGIGSTDIDTAYRFARGVPVVFPRTGQKVQIDRPLDFVVIADHDVSHSASVRLEQREPGMMNLPIARRLLEILQKDGGQALTRAQMFGAGLTPQEWTDYKAQVYTNEFLQTSWAGQVAAAEKYNEPGKFTALIGWEWTSAPDGRNLHRVVFTNVDGDQARKFVPFSNWMSSRPEDLWSYFEQTKARTGADFLAIPHNSNLSDGRMFAMMDSDGNPFSAAYAERRSAWEPVVEISQSKGTAETHPQLSPNDEFAGFELRNMLLSGAPTAVTPGSYVRPALLAGLAEEQRMGRNPFHLGIVGSTDTHTGLSTLQESDFYGKMGEDFLPGERFGPNRKAIVFPASEMSASGLAAVWADHNDRQSLFDAFRRREVYGTSGTRMSVRLFAGSGFTQSDLMSRDFAAIGYRKGVPMGGTLAPLRGQAAPQFMIRAVKDSVGANLDRVQVVKGWVDAAGKTHEKVFDVAWSGGRTIGRDGKLPAVGNTVDIHRARYTNSIGAPELTVLWKDPEFDPARGAFYYVRVLEIPTPRQHLFDALAMGIDPLSLPLPPTIQERAWSSPVWYRPR